jgi:putative tryptophan/tyrosine transport system substrate-binding protein
LFVDAFLQGLRELGYAEGRDFDIVYRFADGYIEQLPTLAEEVVRLHPAVILAAASGPAVAAKKATARIPIVTLALADAVHLGLIASEARPGGNVTGKAPYVAGLPAKQMELAREVVPGAARIGVRATRHRTKSRAHRQCPQPVEPDMRAFVRDFGFDRTGLNPRRNPALQRALT